MLHEYSLAARETSIVEVFSTFLEDWKKPTYKVFVFRDLSVEPAILVETYQALFESGFNFLRLAEDAHISDRQAQRNGETWMDVCNKKQFPDAYRHSEEAQPLHTDGSYIRDYEATIMVCLTNVAIGGETIFLSAADLLAEIKERNPDLLNRLMNEAVTHRRSGESKEQPIIYDTGNQVRVNFNFFCLDQNSKQLGTAFFELLQNMDGIWMDHNVKKVRLNAGDAVIWKDDQVLHGRHSFTATKDKDRWYKKAALELR